MSNEVEIRDEVFYQDYIKQLDKDVKRLEKELKAKPKVSIDFSVLGRIMSHWSIITAIIVLALSGSIYAIASIPDGPPPPAPIDTGRFYIIHSTIHCNYNKNFDCYKVKKEVINAEDVEMSGCIGGKDEAYKIANQFADEWKILKEKSNDRVDGSN